MDTLPTSKNIAEFTGKVWHSKAEDLLNALPDESIDFIITSPPYDNLRAYKGFEWNFNLIAQESHRVLKKGGVLVWVVGDATIKGSETLTSFRQALYFVDVCGFNMHDTMIWEKLGKDPNIHHPRYMQKTEYMFVLSKATPKTFNALLEKNNLAGQSRTPNSTKTQRNGEKGRWGTATSIAQESKRGNVWRYNTGNATQDDDCAFEHPAIFPENLAKDHIHTWSNPDDVVLDFFSGSGTTAKVARNLGRQFIACDISEEYCELACRRLANTDPMQDTILTNGEKQLSLFRVAESEAGR